MKALKARKQANYDDSQSENESFGEMKLKLPEVVAAEAEQIRADSMVYLSPEVEQVPTFAINSEPVEAQIQQEWFE